jgi:hypothetical protein
VVLRYSFAWFIALADEPSAAADARRASSFGGEEPGG